MKTIGFFSINSTSIQSNVLFETETWIMTILFENLRTDFTITPLHFKLIYLIIIINYNNHIPWRGSFLKSFERSTINLLHLKKSILYGIHSAFISSRAHFLKFSFVLKHSEFLTHVLNISLDSWHNFGCFSWSGSKYFSQTYFMVYDMF